ncbi:D-alanyl-D-alanine carboxypeptidase [Hyphococcus flavus]|uniref:serine-type D-Ala-D-Ala carboxypeptidase n=1 Tax=Hyphococcus flavus TaxID=1866326 RepID=A0AAE9ZHP7_9PROT|nr:D-alanyl-D-alanine carboxypeptidase family protein [Hyphococcus flavus]WDI31056.1 D-alanyl-D-alanine carboxypeptidase [Hyphococcus flavus]
MRFLSFFTVITSVLALGLFHGGAAAQNGPVETAAEYAVIMDYRTGEILFEKNARVPTAPASMSKLMTVAIVFERLKDGSLQLTDEFDVSEKAWREREGSSMWVRVDTAIPVLDLLRGIIVQSGNDACIVVAENISGSEEAFAELMNRKAREWGLTDSTFANPHGMPHPNQKMSMRDLALLSRKIISEYGEYYALFAEREFTWERIRQENRNPLLGFVDGADGLKTGHTEESGYGLVGSAVQNGERRIVVVNGLDSNRERTTESARLIRLAFNDFSNKTFFEPGDIVGEAEVFKGKDKSVPLIARAPVDMILHRTQFDDSQATIVYEGPVAAPIRENQQIGFLKITASDGKVREYPLFAGTSVREAGVWGKIGIAAKKLLAKPPSDEVASAQN